MRGNLKAHLDLQTMYNVIYLSVFRLTNIGFATIFDTDLVLREWNVNLKGLNSILSKPKRIEYIRVEFTKQKCKTAILLYCFHTAGVLHIFLQYNLLGPGISFYRKSKIIVKRKPNYEIGWFHN